VLGLVVLALCGRGLWSSEGGGSAPGSSAPAQAASSAEAPAAPEAGPEPAASAAPLGESAPGGAQPAGAAGEDGDDAGIDEDRFETLLALVELRAGQARLPEAWSTVRTLQRQRLSAAQRDAVAAAEAALTAGLAAASARWRERLAAGHVLAVHAELAAAGDGLEACLLALEAALATAGAGVLPASSAATTGELLPAPAALPRGRAVRFVQQGRTLAGVVVDSRAEEVTVRHATADGQAFPTLPRWSVEPIGPSRDEAVEAAIAARRGGDALLGRLWLAAARLQGGEPSPRELLAARGL
jgi:hypothetical protein